jgi:hypothetical protein
MYIIYELEKQKLRSKLQRLVFEFLVFDSRTVKTRFGCRLGPEPLFSFDLHSHASAT